MSFLGRCLDGNDSTIEAPIVLMAVALFGVLGIAAYALVVRNHDVNLSDLGSACGWVLGGGGAAQFGQGTSRRFSKPPPSQNIGPGDGP